MQIVLSMESGYGIRMTKELVNEHRNGNGVERVGLSTVFEELTFGLSSLK
jgi:hypothetical protein